MDNKELPPSSTMEKGSDALQSNSNAAPPADGTSVTFSVPKEELHRGIQQRHLGMIALAGAIGTGLFLGSGRTIAHAGPLGALLGYILVGGIVCCVMFCVGESSTLVPLSGAFVRQAEYFVDPALGFAYGWNVVYQCAISVPAEIVAGAVLFQFWTDVNSGIFITLLGAAIVLSNIISVRWYGETEFIFASLKLMLVTGLIIMGICIDLGGSPSGEVIGFRYWKDPGVFAEHLVKGSSGKFVGFWSVMIGAAYAYASVEQVAACAAETKNPYKSVPNATKRVFYRVGLCYIAGIFVVGLIVPFNDSALLNKSGTASTSAFVLAANRAGIKVLPSIINAIIVTSAWSSGNHAAFAGSRVLYGLALDGQAPAIFKRVNARGIPWVAVLFIVSFMLLAFMSLGNESATQVFAWLQDLVSASTLCSWAIMCLTSLRINWGLQAQKIPRTDLPWAAPGQPYIAWIGLIGSLLILITGGFTNFLTVDGASNFDKEDFIANYFNIPFMLVFYLGYRSYKKTKIVSLHEMPLMYFITKYRHASLDGPGLSGEEKQRTIPQKLAYALWG